MNKTILAGIACTSLLWFTATGCGEDTVLAGEDAGFVAIDLDFDPSPLKTDLAGQSRANAMEISKEDLSLKLTKTSDTSESPKTFTYAEFGDRQKVTIGQYLLVALKHPTAQRELKDGISLTITVHSLSPSSTTPRLR